MTMQKFKEDDVVLVKQDTQNKINYGYLTTRYEIRKIKYIRYVQDDIICMFYGFSSACLSGQDIMGTYNTVYMREHDYAEV